MMSLTKALFPAFIICSLFSILCFADSVDFIHVRLKKSKCSASSSLIEKGKPADYYGPEKAFDGPDATAWCEGKDDAGINEYITSKFQPTKIFGIVILNGFGKYKNLYLSNNRVKDFTITLYQKNGSKKIITSSFRKNVCGKNLDGGKTTIEGYCMYEVLDYKKNKKAYNKCIKKKQNECIIDEYEGGGQTFFLKKPVIITKLKLEILSVYKGTKYNDTCIAEIRLLKLSGNLSEEGYYHLYKDTKKY